MSSWLLIIPWLAPLLLLPVPVNRTIRWLQALAALPALATAMLAADGLTGEFDWLLLGTRLGIDDTGRLFLLYSSLVWLAASLYTLLRPALATGRSRFRIAFLLAMSGNFLLILAADMLSFYLGFALMGLSAYGMIVAPGTGVAIKAGRRYLGWTIAGELALFSGMVLLASRAGGRLFTDLASVEPGSAGLVLILVGFGVKMALPGLHFWLPAAYRAAPAAAAAVLSGPMLAAGLLGWLRFLNPATVSDYAILFMTLGIAGALLGFAGGALQREARGVLAWSSIAKAGTMSAILGAAFAWPDSSTAILAALSLFMIHHLLIKSALFLGMGELETRGRHTWLMAGLALLALSLAGAPWSGGAAAKELLIRALGNSDPSVILLFMSVAAGTAMLMTRFLWLTLRSDRCSKKIDAISVGWLALAIPATWLPFELLQAGFSMSALWTLLAGMGLFAVTRSLGNRRQARTETPKAWPRMEWTKAYGDSLVRVRHALIRHLRASLAAIATGSESRKMSGTTTSLLWLALFMILLITLVVPV
ncbi:MAG: proton-conducting transporter membrane subunit [Chromatiales bacterium]|jgi:formate hydrogenlyase subunit 3/multisubunit Na+/H+ antiporter MnhD subunit